MDEERKAHKENSLETKQTDFRKTENKQAGNNRNDKRREYSHTVRHVITAEDKLTILGHPTTDELHNVTCVKSTAVEMKAVHRTGDN